MPEPSGQVHSDEHSLGRLPDKVSGRFGSLTSRLVLQMALRISAVVLAVSVFSYYQSIRNIEDGIKQQLTLFTSLRTHTESQWLIYLENRLDDLRQEYLSRYLKVKDVPVTDKFDRYFRMIEDGTGFPHERLYTGMDGHSGERYSGFSGGIDNEFPMTDDRQKRLVLAQEMLFQFATSIIKPNDTLQHLMPSIDFYFTTPEKDLLAYWPGVPWYPDFKGGFDLATQGDFAKIFDTAVPYEKRKRSWSRIYRDEVAKVWMVSFSLPIVLSKRNLAGIAVDISLSDINYRLTTSRFEGSTSLILRRDGLLIAHPTLEKQMIDKKGEFFLQQQDDAALRDLYTLVAERSGESFIDDAVHDRFISVGSIDGPDWLLVTTYPKHQLNGAAMNTVQYIIIIGVISLLMEVFMLWWVLRRSITKPLNAFVTMTRAIAEGDMSLRPQLARESNDEFGMLARAFLEMMDSVNEAKQTLLRDLSNRERIEEQLRISEERWKFALEGSGQGVWDWEIETNNVTYSTQWKKMLGLDADEIEADYHSWESRVHPDDKQHVLDALQGHLAGLNPYSVELRLRCKDGSWKWVLDRGMVVRRDSEGRPLRVSGTITDISDIKAIENELRLTNETLERRVTERTQQLDEARHQAEVASEAKSQFLANMSHDIRTPMNSIIGMATLALRTSLNDKQRDYLEKIDQSAQYLLGILNDILDISKIEAGKMTLETVEFNLSTLFDQLHSQLAHSASTKHLALGFSIDPGLETPLCGDPLRLSQVLNNLVGNALKFTPQGTVEVSATRLQEDDNDVQVKFTVADTGIGLSSDMAARLFEPFQQADTSTARQFGGTGLGLAICKQLVLLMRGEIGVQSELNKGSEFWFTVRLAKGTGLLEHRVDVISAERDLSLHGTRLLLVEDNRFNQQVAKELLEQAGATVAVCSSGDQALARLQVETFDCVLMDVQMPGMDGYEATRRIRATPAVAQSVVIAMTANARDEDRIRCREAGMDDFVAKPINPHRLFATLNRWINKLHVTPAVAYEPSPASNSSEINLCELERMWGGNREKIEKYALLFVDTVRNDLADVGHAIERGDLAQISDIGHRGKSSAMMLGAEKISALFLQLEKMGDHGDLAQARELFAELIRLLNDADTQIAQALAKLKKGS